jgi:hypothetical protein
MRELIDPHKMANVKISKFCIMDCNVSEESFFLHCFLEFIEKASRIKGIRLVCSVVIWIFKCDRAKPYRTNKSAAALCYLKKQLITNIFQKTQENKPIVEITVNDT